MTSEDLRGIRLNPEANDLECLNINDIYKRCIVPKSHFINKNSGYYYTYHANHNDKSIMFAIYKKFASILIKSKEHFFF